MKLRRLSLVVSLIGVVYLSNIIAQGRPRYRKPVQHKAEKPPAGHNSAELDLCYSFYVGGETSKIRFVVLLPRTITDKQEISIKYSPEPLRVFRKNGNRYAEFVFIKPKKRFKVKVQIKGKLFRYDLSTARKNRNKRPSKGPNFEDFLKHEKYIEKDNAQIQQIAKSIEGKTETDIVKRIYEYVADNMEYGGYKEDELGAVKALQQKKGDCSEYAALFVALCRAENIPARIVYGYTTDYEDTAKHGWAEVYLEKYGWVPFDPTRGDVKSRFERSRRFRTLEPIYIYFGQIRNSQVMGEGHYYGYWYWGDEIKVKESVEFKQHGRPQPKPN